MKNFIMVAWPTLTLLFGLSLMAENKCPKTFNISQFYEAITKAKLVRAAPGALPEDKRVFTLDGVTFFMPAAQRDGLVQENTPKMGQTGMIGVDFVRAEELANRVQCHYIVHMKSFYMATLPIPDFPIRLTYLTP